MATSKTDITSDEIINIKCCVCITKNRTREADRYCVECKDYYCLSCSDKHKNFPALRSHKLLDKADFRSQGPDGSLPSFVTQRCAQHQSEVVNMFCKDHNDVVCATCVALNHRFCSKIHYIPEDVDNLYNKTELTNMKQKINKTKKTMEDIKSAKENEVKELEEVFNKEVESVKAFRKELETLLANIEQETITKLKQEFERIELRLTNEIKEVNKLIDDINEASLMLKKSEGNSTQEFVIIKSSEKVTTKAQKIERENQKKTKETTGISFSADQKITTFLQQIQTFGSVSSIEQCTTDKNDKLYKVKSRREINVKLANDTSNCDIECCCLTEEGCLLLTDSNNNKLKRLDMSTETVKDYLDFPTYPHAVCLVSKTEAAVTLHNNTVQFVYLGNKLTASRSLQINHYCYGLVHGKLYISDDGKNVYIHDMNGLELQRVSTDTAGKEIFQYNRHLTISAGGDRVFVANRSKGVIILDIQVNYLSTLTDPGRLSGSVYRW